MSRCLKALFLCWLVLGAIDPAPRVWGQETARAEASAERSPTPESRFADLMDQAMRLAEAADFRQAEKRYEEALALREREFGAEDPGAADVLIHLALMATVQGRVEEAELLFKRAEPIASASPQPFDYPRYLSYRAVFLTRIGKLDDAKEHAEAATRVRRDILQSRNAGNRRSSAFKAALSGSLIEIAQSLFVETVVGYRRGEFERVLPLAEAARRIIADVDSAPRWWLPHVDELIALIETELGDIASARERLERAAVTKRLTFGETRPSAYALLSLGHVLDRDGDLEASVGEGKRGVGILRSGENAAAVVSADRVLGFLQPAYERAQSDSGEGDTLYAEMFVAAQLASGGVTAETVARMAAKLAARDPAQARALQALQDAVQRRDTARLELGRERASAPRLRDKQRIARLVATYRESSGRVEALEAKLYEEAPEIARLTASAPMHPADIRQSLAEDEGLILYVVGTARSFAVLVTGSGVLTAAPIPAGKQQLNELVGRVRAAFTLKDDGLPEFDFAAAAQLYELVLRPLAPALDKVAHIHLVAPGALASVPFGVLVTAPVQAGEDYARAGWVARRWSTSLAPSVRSFHSLRLAAKPSRASRPFIGFGDAAFRGGGSVESAADACRNGAPMPATLLRALAPLPGTATEVREIAKVFGSGAATYLGNRMTEPAVRSSGLDQYRIVYFATHGLLPDELKCQAEPALALTPPARTPRSTARDGLLETNEIAQLKLDAELVVLSACNTAAGSRNFGGESLTGLSRSFFHAGARNLLVSHWVVESKAAVRLMIDLFRDWRPGQTARALQRAQRAMIEDPARSHPFFWGPFTVVGTG